MEFQYYISWLNIALIIFDMLSNYYGVSCYRYNFSILKYDLEAVSGAGVVTRLLEGTITLSKEVTK